MMQFRSRSIGLSVVLTLIGLSGIFGQSTNHKEVKFPETANLQKDALQLWYNQPAEKWTDALPIGNGHIGAMIYGGVDSEHIQFNEATLWTGRPRSYAHPEAVKYLPKIRQLLFDGHQKLAEALAEQHFMGIKNHDPVVYQTLRRRWLEKVRRDTTASAADFDDHGWKTMKLPLINGWESGGFQGLDGAVWFRVDFEVPKSWNGKDIYVDLGRIRDQDYCYINGHYAGNTEGISTKRHYLLKAKNLRPGKNTLALQVVNFFDKGGFTGVKNDRKIFVIYPKDSTPEEAKAIPSTWRYWIQDKEPPAYPQYEASYQPFGDIIITDLVPEKQPITEYKRSLSLDSATASVSYRKNDVYFTRKYWASASDPVMVMAFGASESGALQFKATFSSVHENKTFYKIDDQTIGMRVRVKDGALYGVSELRLKTWGKKASIQVSSGALQVKGADSATLYLVAATNFKNYKDVSGDPEAICQQFLKAITPRSTSTLLSRHLKRYWQLFKSFQVGFGKDVSSATPTDQRILQYSPEADPGLLALYIQYARYLMISASPPGGRAANLQGIWNELLTPPWGSKYTTNINLEMNYWPVELLHLSACSEPLFAFMNELAVSGHITAKEQYGAPGWVEHHNTDIWAATAPIDASAHGIWVGGAAWLCHQLWEHYLFTKDTTFLAKTAYPLMQQAAAFYAHFLIKDPKTGYLISTPSNSPEHGGLVAGPTMDHQLIRDLFGNCIAAQKVLQIDSLFGRELKDKYARIAPNKIGRMGQLQEWMEDIDDSTDTHRHVSHLWGVYPGNDINWNKDSTMMRAARKSTLMRGDDGTGWSLAWKVNLWARFKDGNHAMRLLNELLRPAEGASGGERGGVYHNLMDAHPPFQIDGNFGGAAAVAEMLVQSQNGYIELLPAIPDALPVGYVKGICARGGFVLDVSWLKGKLQTVSVYSTKDGPCQLRYQQYEILWNAKKGEHYHFDSKLKKL